VAGLKLTLTGAHGIVQNSSIFFSPVGFAGRINDCS
jgi:hypothetical protein